MARTPGSRPDRAPRDDEARWDLREPLAETPEQATERRRKALSRDLSRYMGLGLQFAASVGVLTFAGYWLDGRAGTLPLFTLLGVLLGFVGATISLVRHVPPVRSKNDPADPPST